MTGRRAAFLLPLGLVACGTAAPLRPPEDAAGRAAAADWAAAETVTVVLDDYAFRPADLLLRAGRPVRLRFVNEGVRPHDWTSPGFFRAVETRPDDAAASRVLAAGGSVDVPAGGAVEVAVLPLAPGRHEVECRRPLHAMLGMTGRVVVEG